MNTGKSNKMMSLVAPTSESTLGDNRKLKLEMPTSEERNNPLYLSAMVDS